jgi:hypothetical protein
MAQHAVQLWPVMKSAINSQEQLNVANFMINWDILLLKKDSIPRNLLII